MLVFTAVWSILLGASIYVLLADDDVAETEPDQAVAELTLQHGETEVRAENSLRWTEAKLGQSLTQEQGLATRANGSATITFRDGRRVQLGHDTQITITQEGHDANTHQTYVIHLVNGSLTTLPPVAPPPKPIRFSGLISRKVAAAPPPPTILKISSGTNNIVLTSASDQVQAIKPIFGQLAIAKASVGVEIKATPFSPGAPTLSDPVKLAHLPFTEAMAPKEEASSLPDSTPTEPIAGGAMSEPRGTLAPEAAPKPVAALHTPPPLSTKGLEPQLVLPRNSQVFWTTVSLRDPDLILSVPFGELPTLSSDVAWLPFVRVGLAAGGSTLVVRGEGNAFKLALSELLRKTAATPHGEILDLHLAAGAVVQRGGDKKLVMAKKVRPLHLGSLADLSKVGALTIQVVPGTWQAQAGAKDWFQVTPTQAGPQVVTLRLSDGKDLMALAPLIQGASSFMAAAAESGLAKSQATCFVRNGRVVATAQGAPLAPSVLTKIAGALRATLTYQGAVTAFLVEPRTGSFHAKLAAASKAPLYVYDARRGDGRYQVLPDTLLHNPLMSKYIEAATALFTQPVTMLQMTQAAH
ncbi:MAG: hypothetical protein NTZ90_07965 [Proteobacteria bacterium]|nr:hypothetical protein [Pseudomonadota bacterium]